MYELEDQMEDVEENVKAECEVRLEKLTFTLANDNVYYMIYRVAGFNHKI